MALSAATVWEVRTTATANNVNGGGFVTGATGTDYSQQDAAQFALTSITSAGAGDTFLTATAASTMVGNICRVVSGTNFTAGWYEIIAVSAGVSVQVDRAVTTGAGSNGVINIGGALSMNSTLDDDIFEAIVGGNLVWIKAGTYALGENIAVGSTSSTSTSPTCIFGYNSTRGDNPALDNCPLFANGANTITFGQFMNVKNLQVTSTGTTALSMGVGTFTENVRVKNTSTTAARVALAVSTNASAMGVDLVSQNGTGLTLGSGARGFYSYIHDSNIGAGTAQTTVSVVGNLFEGNRTGGFSLTTGSSHLSSFLQNTFYGREAKIGYGISLADVSATAANRLYNNIFYGLDTGVSVDTTNEGSNAGGFNDFFNNTANGTNYTLDSTDLTLNPTFNGASQITGTTATTSGSVLTQSGGDFSTVTDNVDYLHVLSGTGVTTGGYLITSHTGTTLTVNNALGTSSGGDVVYYVTSGKDFKIGTNLKALGVPKVINADTTAYVDIGAVQRQESSSSGSVGFVIL